MDRYRTKECFSDVDVEGTLYKDELKILPGLADHGYREQLAALERLHR